MVRLAELPDVEREHLLGKACEPFDSKPWADGPPLAERRVALVTTAGLHRASDRAFSMVDLSYRVIPGDIRADELTMTHSSVHFDRSGFREDVNLVFPIDRLRELEQEGVIGSVAEFHYSLMGAGWLPQQIEPTVAELARLLRTDEVDAVCLIPV
ncbi:MAG: glycine/sarcosine/betaine reductase selenoprotein B family protein [Candidatus Binatia bacterium]|nr:glycine/sarcosine/betaine reductase selenoprotein B family protein [Candidatus Binatia bacterium]